MERGEARHMTARTHLHKRARTPELVTRLILHHHPPELGPGAFFVVEKEDREGRRVWLPRHLHIKLHRSLPCES